jgi:hypothetical protein
MKTKAPLLTLSKDLKRLSPSEKERVLRYGRIAIPTYDEDGSLTQRYSAFLYVWQVFESKGKKVFDTGNREKELFRCLTEALKQRDGTVFKHIADAIDEIAVAEKIPAYPIHLAILKANQPADELREIWGSDCVGTNADVLASLKRNPLNSVDKRTLRRAKKEIGLELNPGQAGRPKTKSNKRAK